MPPYLSNIVRLAHLVDHSPRRVLPARDDRNHVPRIPIPIHDRRLLSFALPDCLNLKPESMTGRPGARDVEFFGAVAAADYCTASLGAETARLYKIFSG